MTLGFPHYIIPKFSGFWAWQMPHLEMLFKAKGTKPSAAFVSQALKSLKCFEIAGIWTFGFDLHFLIPKLTTAQTVPSCRGTSPTASSNAAFSTAAGTCGRTPVRNPQHQDAPWCWNIYQYVSSKSSKC